MDSTHRALIREQFTRQAVPFANAPAIRNVEMLDRIVDLSGAIASDTVLDVGCGPGLLACAFAARVRSVTGIDVTTAMLQQARAEQRSRKLPNAHWVQADATCLPYRDDEFSLVTSRLTFHHLVQPLAVLCPPPPKKRAILFTSTLPCERKFILISSFARKFSLKSNATSTPFIARAKLNRCSDKSNDNFLFFNAPLLMTK